MSTDDSSLRKKSQTNRRTLGEWLTIDGISYIPSTVLLTGILKVSLKDNFLFAMLDAKGESPRVYRAELGIYVSDTRYLSHWEMSVNGEQLVYLSHELRGQGNACVFSMTNRDLPSIDGKTRIQRDSLLIRRVLTLYQDTVFEHLEFTNYDVIDHELEIEQNMGSSFDDIFEVRGVQRSERGRVLPPVVDDHGMVFGYEGLDGITRHTFVQTNTGSKCEAYGQSAAITSRIIVPAKGRADMKTVVSFDVRSNERIFEDNFEIITVSEHLKILEDLSQHAYLGEFKIRSDNVIFDRSMKNARMDIEMLTTYEPSSKLVYPYAGIPWFSAPFGRDGLITAYQTLPFYPRLAQGVLEYVFQTIGTKVDAFTDEEPGKIFHELRRGEMANLRQIPYIPYYGSVDATPLALILLGEYLAWTHDEKSLRTWWPSVRKAMDWMDQWGDRDGDGFIEYIKRSPAGLDNQGWKDSHNSIMYANGVLAQPPIELCEVQAYAYRARLEVAALARFLGESDFADALNKRAAASKAEFRAAFWDPTENYVYLARDGHKEPCRVMSSNQGHCLWGGILDAADAQLVADHLMSARLFSGYGVRTLAADEKSYNPLSYHNGSVWPHDNSLILEGLRRYDQIRHLQTLTDALFDVVAMSDDYRLPELFCGFRRRTREPPVPYEVACRPQAWAAGSMFLMIKAMFGLGMSFRQSEIIFQSPILPSSVNSVEIDGLRIRDTEFNLVITRGHDTCHVEVTRRSGPMRILVQK
ncbi:MAG: amylo-alpha-1,6-glucosidase [Deltaproteobacteria bacterium]|nr:amylo-alpha-1,6-glucosidase [Deltaproteobacteria bacterium]